MSHKTKQNSGIGVSISLPIPAQDADLFKHGATNDVLSFLSGHRLDEFSLRQLSTQVDHSLPTVKRTVDVLSANDLVVVQSEGNKRLVRINPDRLSVPEDPILRIPQSEFHRPVQTAVDRLTAALDDVVAIVCFGSVARGEADRRSDIDLWVLVRGDRAANQRAANTVKGNLEDQSFDGDRYCYDIDVEAVGSIPTYTDAIRDIVVSGIPVYETDDFETVETLLLEATENE